MNGGHFICLGYTFHTFGRGRQTKQNKTARHTKRTTITPVFENQIGESRLEATEVHSIYLAWALEP